MPSLQNFQVVLFTPTRVYYASQHVQGHVEVTLSKPKVPLNPRPQYQRKYPPSIGCGPALLVTQAEFDKLLSFSCFQVP
jgi:hypothetical protein